MELMTVISKMKRRKKKRRKMMMMMRKKKKKKWELRSSDHLSNRVFSSILYASLPSATGETLRH